MLLNIHELEVGAATRNGMIEILKGVNLRLDPGDRLGLIGESGSGKTTLVRALIGLLDANMRVTGGSVDILDGQPLLNSGTDSTHMFRGRHIGVVFQSALTSLHPLRRLGKQFDEVVALHQPGLKSKARRALATDLLLEMGIQQTERVLNSYPHEVSGGQRQRVAIALALASDPEIVIADECTSALDVRTQDQVVKLFSRVIGQDRGLLFVTHDLALASQICNKFVVLERGTVVEAGSAADVLFAPQHEYTKSLLKSIPPWAARTGTWPPRATAVRPNEHVA